MSDQTNTAVNDVVVERLKSIIDNDLTRKERRLGDSDLANVVFDRFTEGWNYQRKAEVSWDIKHAVREIIRQRRQEALAQHRVGTKYLV